MRRYWMKDVIMCHGSNCVVMSRMRTDGWTPTYEDEWSEQVKPCGGEKGDDDVSMERVGE